MDLPPVTHTLSRRRDSIVALSTGGAVFFIALAGKGLFASGYISMCVLLMVALSSAVAAGIAASFLPLAKLPKEVGLPLAGRTGGRTGMLAGFLAAGMIVMGVHLGATSNPLFVWLPAILSVLPGALAGILAAALIGNGVQESQAETPNTALKEVPGGGGWFCGVLALAIFGFFSPLFLPYGITRPAPRVAPPEKPIIAEQAPAPAPPPPEPIKLVPPPPPFEFKPDPELAKTPPEGWNLADVKTLEDVDVSESSPVALSADGHMLACNRRGTEGKEVKLIDLLSLKTLKVWSFSYPVTQICFSGDEKQLLLFGTGAVSVAREDGSVIDLPLLEPLPPVDLAVDWPTANEALFYRSGKPSVVLNLETLLLEEDAKETFARSLREGATWRFTNRTICQTATNPPPSGSLPEWNVGRTTCLAVEHPTQRTARLFPFHHIRDGDRILASPDGTILLRFSQRDWQAYYFTRREPVPLEYEVTMPHEPEKFPDGSPLREAANRSRLRVMAYPPLLNPLTGKAIGPDRAKIRARARLIAWEGTKARLRLFDITEPLAADSVFADLHTEDKGTFELIGLQAPHRWWVAVGEPTKNASAMTQDQTPSSTAEPLTLTYHRGAFIVGKVPSSNSGPSPVASRIPPPSGPLLPPESKTPFPAAPAVQEPDSLDARIRRFVFEHHAKASRGDWTGVCNNYGVFINYFGQNIKTFPTLADRQRDYHGKFKVTETIIEPLAITKRGDGQFEVRYELQSDIVSEGKPAERKRPHVILVIRDGERGLEITSHTHER